VEIFWPVSGYSKSYPAALNQLNILDEEEGQQTTNLTQGDSF
jgi:hypothetical protein